jgi:hypothetical protein
MELTNENIQILLTELHDYIDIYWFNIDGAVKGSYREYDTLLNNIQDIILEINRGISKEELPKSIWRYK